MPEVHRPVLGPLAAGLEWSGPSITLRPARYVDDQREILGMFEVPRTVYTVREFEPVLDDVLCSGALLWPTTPAGLRLYKHYEIGSLRWLCDDASIKREPDCWWTDDGRWYRA